MNLLFNIFIRLSKEITCTNIIWWSDSGSTAGSTISCSLGLDLFTLVFVLSSLQAFSLWVNFSGIAVVPFGHQSLTKDYKAKVNHKVCLISAFCYFVSHLCLIEKQILSCSKWSFWGNIIILGCRNKRFLLVHCPSSSPMFSCLSAYLNFVGSWIKTSTVNKKLTKTRLSCVTMKRTRAPPYRADRRPWFDEAKLCLQKPELNSCSLWTGLPPTLVCS